jgi:hypothetical protein
MCFYPFFIKPLIIPFPPKLAHRRWEPAISTADYKSYQTTASFGLFK